MMGLSILHAENSANSAAARDALMQQMDEERLAYQLYTALGEMYPSSRQFQNIPRSEARHFNALKSYFVKNHPDIKALDLTGDFIFPATQALYDRLYSEGQKSLAAAMQVGVQVEELDIKDLDLALAVTEDEQLKAIYQRLRTGSQHHLAAFSGNQGGKWQQGWRGDEQEPGSRCVEPGCRKDKQRSRCVEPGGCNVKQGNRDFNRGFREGNQGCGGANSGKGNRWRQAVASPGM